MADYNQENLRIATTTEAQAGTADTVLMTPLLTAAAITAQAGALGALVLAAQGDAETGTDNTKFVTPLRVAQQTTARLATTGDITTGTNTTKLVTPAEAKLAAQTWAIQRLTTVAAGTTFASPVEGDMYYNTTTKAFTAYINGAWNTLTATPVV